jgi:phage terminase large subunit-like protein
MTTLDLPRLRRDQWMIACHPAKTKVLSMGRRWGKTVLGGCVSLATAAQGGKVAWVVPTYRNGRPLWRWAEATTGALRKAGRVTANRSERLIEFADTGGFLGIYSADSPDSIRGESFHLVVMDEAARISQETWQDAIQPTLADTNGDAILISTPKGRNWFWQEWVRGRGDGSEVASWQAPTRDNPAPNIQRAAGLVRERVPDRTYRQEWLAEFVEGGGGVFRRVAQAATAGHLERGQDGHAYVFGVDWGKSNDWTVVTVLDAATRHMVYLDRFHQIDYALQTSRLKALAERFGPQTIIAERNSMGEPLIETLLREGLPVQPFLTTNATKTTAIDALALAFERGELAILNEPVLVGELEAYEAERLPSGLLRYGAPEGMHDDCVMSLALAWQGVALAAPLFAWQEADDDD